MSHGLTKQAATLERPRAGRPRWLALYILAVDAAGLTVMLATLHGLPPKAVPTLALFFALTTLTEFWRIPITAHGEVSLSVTSKYAAAVLFGPAFGALVGCVGSLVDDGLRRRGLLRTAFNAGQFALVGGLCGLTYFALRSDGTLSLTTNALAYVASAAVYLLANATLSSGAIALYGRRFARVFRQALREGGVFYIAMAPLGALAAFCYAQSPWTLLCFPVLISVVYKGFDLYARLRTETANALVALADALERRDPYTYEHSVRVAEYAARIGESFGLMAEDLDLIVSAARVHDLGKISIDNRILFKKGRLIDEERRQVNMHSAAGADLAGQFSMYGLGAKIIRHHHERWDGAGYPDGLAGEAIPLGARIIAVADVYDAMTSDRPYRRALSHHVAISELSGGKGSQFDPAVVDAFLALEAAPAACGASGEDRSRREQMIPTCVAHAEPDRG
jgi:uncharacterized membrane protein